ncbi:response regulator [Deinococcus kurensis]|uniref:response regulator n=1 Tax=Deinococcus kurensis TaxID=2662757 RepID=UPI0012D2B08B|nr:response regulator [Deinococcus kurensis]
MSLITPLRPLQILLVDDEPAAQLLAEAAFEPYADLARLHVLPDPRDTLAWLRRAAASGAAPDLVLLDLNMPGSPGLTLLNLIRDDPALKQVRVVVLATSAESADITAAYAQGAVSYLIKPGTFTEFQQQVHTLVTYWHLMCSMSPQS